jgi:integrative and conjugative element protein (TIGR02256 family)
MKFSRDNGGVVEFRPAVNTTMERYRQVESHAKEAGGMLLGRLINESTDLVIDEATEPTNSDRKGRFFFIRRRRHAQRRVDAAWHGSNGTLNYLGEWHTHPEDNPSPSTVDIDNWLTIGQTARYDHDCLVFAIVGRKGTRAWELSKSIGILHELSLMKRG